MVKAAVAGGLWLSDIERADHITTTLVPTLTRL
jgi:hypothetical protein